MATVIVMSKGNKEIEWTERFEANTLKSAKAAASKWIKRNLFESDYSRIEKEDATSSRAYWTII